MPKERNSGKPKDSALHRAVRPVRPVPRMTASAEWPSAVHHSEEEIKGGSNDAESGDDADADDDTKWEYNCVLDLVLHDLEHCRMCNEFALHHSRVKIRSYPSYRTACTAREAAMQRRINDCQHQLELLKENRIPSLQRSLEDIRQETMTARVNWENQRMKLEEVRRELGRLAASGPKSSL